MMNYQHVKSRKYEYCTSCERPIKLKNDLVGQRFGKLLVIDYAENKVQPNGSTKKQFKCVCDCGNECVVQSAHLISGHTTSCGCEQKRITGNAHLKDITGMRFGKLTAVERVYVDNEPKWRCICDCGNEKITDIRNLTSGKTSSCGCIMSVAEHNMKTILTDKGYEFKQEYKYPDCKDKRSLPFDFAVIKNGKIVFLIELQGQQHYYPYTFHSESKDVKNKNYENRVKKDNIKANYCKEHNIPLLIIKYTKFDSMDTILDEFINQLGE